jgi:hypothetical protein
VVDKAAPVLTLLAAVRRVGNGHEALGRFQRDAFESAVARLDDEDLPDFGMLLDREPIDPIAQALRADPADVARRAKADRRPSSPPAWRASRRPCA